MEDERMDPTDLAAMFSAGAYTVAKGRGMTDKQAEDFALGLVKDAAGMRRPRWAERDDDDDDDEETLWDRVKGFLIPAAVGTGAYLLGSHAARWNGWRADRGAFSNGLNYLGDKLKTVLGIVNGPLRNAFTKTPFSDPEDEFRQIEKTERHFDGTGKAPKYNTDPNAVTPDAASAGVA